MVDTDDMNALFRMLDSNENGYIDKEKLQRLCPHLSHLEIDSIFNDLDQDHDDRICLKELLQSNDDSTKFHQENATNYHLNTPGNMTHTQIKKVFDDLACQEQIFDFYELLRSGPNESVEQFQSILEIFVADVLKYRQEIKRLEDSYKREKETNEKFLSNIEEDQERDMRQLEDTVRQEERQKFDLERELILQRTAKEINDLQSKLRHLQTIEQIHLERRNEEDSSTVTLREEIARLVEENQTLNTTFNDSLTSNAILQSDLQSIKTQLNERQTMLLQEKQSSSSNHRDKESLQSNVRQLVEVNKQLRDENDSLRAVIDSNRPNAIADAMIPASPQRLKSTADSIVASYWSNPRLDNRASPSYVTRNPSSFDLGSADEIGTTGSEFRSIYSSTIPVPPSQISSIEKSTTHTSNIESNNTTNDSGLSLTTARDVTEIDSDHESKSNQPIPSNDFKQLRLLISKKDKDATDSDDVFPEIPLAPVHLKRKSQRRTGRRGENHTQSSKTSLEVTSSPLVKRADESTTIKIQEALPFDRMFKIVFCGDAAVGKSTLIMRLCKGRFVSNVTSTLGVDYQNKQIQIDGKCVALQLWDTAGQERFRSVARSYFRRCDGVILVYDATYERSFLNVREWINTITDSTPKKVSVMIVANKIDLRDQMRAEDKRVIERMEGIKLAREHKALFIETSAKDGTNVGETLIELARDMQCNEDLERFRAVGVDLDKETKKLGCCSN